MPTTSRYCCVRAFKASARPKSKVLGLASMMQTDAPNLSQRRPVRRPVGPPILSWCEWRWPHFQGNDMVRLTTNDDHVHVGLRRLEGRHFDAVVCLSVCTSGIVC